MSGRIVLYGTGECVLNKARKLAESVCVSLELPEDVLAGETKLSMVGGKRLLIENHRGLLSYSDSAIEVRTAKGKLSVLVNGFIIRAMRDRELLIFGKIQSVEWCG